MASSGDSDPLGSAVPEETSGAENSAIPAGNPRAKRIPTWKQPLPWSAVPAPAAVVFAAVVVGVVLDRWTQWPLWLWWWATVACLTLSTVSGRWSLRLQTASLWMAALAFGGAWHHWHWSIVAPTEISAWATETSVPCRLQGTIVRAPFIVHPQPGELPAAIPQQDRTIFVIEATSLQSSGGFVPVSGQVRCEVTARMPDLRVGSELTLVGSLSRPGAVRNPGGFDFAAYLREQGIHCILRCEFAEAVTVDRPGSPLNWWAIWRKWAQDLAAERLRSGMSAERGAVAVAMLLGPREEISWELREAFLHSGTLHFLAISGINVAILVMFVWPGLRLTRWSARSQSYILMAVVVCYVALTEADPPVLRAALLVLVWLWGRAQGATAAPLNHLALAGLLLILYRPQDLFQAGAQLSFLAVLALQWVADRSRWFRDDVESEPAILRGERSLLESVGDWLYAWLAPAFIATCAVWLFTLPLVLGRFQMLTPVGFVINLVLAPAMSIVLLVGYGALIFSIIPGVGWAFRLLFELCLYGFLAFVNWAADLPGSHLPLPGPPEWWLAVCYSGLFAVGAGWLTGRAERRFWLAWTGWCLLGLCWGLPAHSTPELRVTALSVGHGSAILLELPNGQTWLYDAGSLQNARRAQQTIQGFLADRGRTRIDALWISHGDLDHFNAVPGLVRHFSIKQVLVSPALLRSDSLGVQTLFERLIQAGVPVRVVWRGDVITVSDTLQAEVLHPRAEASGGSDNQHSLVLSLTYGRTGVLLTGDLERGGLGEVLQLPARQHDVLLAPHHGSATANPPDLARWVAPRYVVMSGGRSELRNRLQEVYGPAAMIFSTNDDGAIEFSLLPDGAISTTAFLHSPGTRGRQLPVLPELGE